MKIEIKTNAKGRPIGYDLVPENMEERNTLGTVRDLLFFGFDETHIKYDGIELGGNGDKVAENLERVKFLQKKYKDINTLISDVELYKYMLNKDWDYGGTEYGIDQENRLFEVLDEKFNWNVDQEENVKHMQYLNKATDMERCDYLLNVIIPTLD